MLPMLNRTQWQIFGEDAQASDLLRHFAHWIYRCGSTNASTTASIRLGLYVTTARGQRQYTHLRKGIDTKPVTTKRLDFMRSSYPNLAQKFANAQHIEEVTEHIFLDLWKHVNSFMNGYEMMELLQLYQELTPNSFLYVVKNSLGVPEELWILPSQWVRIVPDKDKFIKGYLYGTSAANQVALAEDEVIHFKFPNPHDPINGFSPLQGCLSAVIRKEAMDAYEGDLLKNNARPDFILSGQMTEDQARTLREEWTATYGRQGERGKPALMSGELKIDQIGFPPKEMSFLGGHKFTMEEIAGAFCVPISKLVPDAKYSNAEIGERQYRADAILPRCRRMQDKLNERLIPLYDERLFVAFDNPVPEDREFQLRERESNLRTFTITINEARASEGMESVPWGDEPFIPSPIGGIVAPVERAHSCATHTATKAALPDGTRFDTSQIAAVMRRVYGEMQTQVMGSLRKVKQLKDYDFTLDLAYWIGQVSDRIGLPLKRQLVRGGQAGLDRVGAQIAFDVMNPQVQDWLKDYVYHFSSITTRTLADDLKAEFEQSSREGEGLRELTGRIQAFFGDMKESKAETIARSETSRAIHHGMREGWRQSDVVEGVQWEAHDLACPFCQAMDGKVVPLDTPFLNLGESIVADGKVLTANYEPVMGGDLHPACICTILAVLKEED
jgi:HK97 family phage portal protein